MKFLYRRTALAFLLAGYATLGWAQPKPALVQDRDEPGRNPYQQQISVAQNTTNCGGLVSLCSVSFDAVPAGKRLVVTFASATFSTDPSTTNPLVYFGPTHIPNFAHVMPLPQSRGTRHIVSGPVLFYVEAGEMPYGIVQASPLTDGGTASFAISGYYVSVP